jgi:hypothetical protein
LVPVVVTPPGWVIVAAMGAALVVYVAGDQLVWGSNAAANRAAIANAVDDMAARLTRRGTVGGDVPASFAVKGPARPIATHLQKLSGGEVQFPGMPPLDPKDYKDRRPDGGTEQHWLRELNTQLQRYVRKYPGQTLEKILQKDAGLSAEEAARYVDSVIDVANKTLPRIKHLPEVNPQTIQQFRTLLEQLGVVIQ